MSNEFPLVSADADAHDVAAPLAELQDLHGRGTGSQGTGGTRVRRMLAAVIRYKWVVLGLGLLGTGAGVVASRFMKPAYVAEATIWISGEDASRSGPIRPSELFQNTAWLDLLRSYAVLDYVVKADRLYIKAPPTDMSAFSGFSLADRFAPGKYDLEVDGKGRGYRLLTGKGQVVETGQTVDSIGRRMGFRWRLPPGQAQPGRRIQFEILTPRDAARDLAGTITPRLPENGNFLTISFKGEDPEKVASVVNTLVDRYIAMAAELKSAKQRELARILAAQMATAQDSLRSAEAQLQGFRVTTITLPSDAGTPVTPGLESTQASAIGNYFNMKLEKESLRRAQTAVRTALGSPGDTAVSVDALAAIDAVNRSPELAQALKELTDRRASLRAMLQQFTPEYAGVRKLNEDIRGLESRTIPRLARDLLVDLSQREANLDALIAQASGDLQQIPPRAINEARLRRQVEVSTSIYTMLQQRYAEASLAAQSNTPDIQILDRAVVPSAPVSDKRWTVIVFGLLGGLGVGVLVGLGVDRLDPRVRYPEHITQGMRLTILGAVPHVKLGRGAHELRPALEAIRGIRLNVVHAHGVGPIVLTVSSAGPGDGKTFLSANLALAFADMEQRTLVIDGDVRRGELHRLYGGARKPGLTDFLAGKVGLEQLIQRGQGPLLDFIGSGSRMPEGPELLASATMRKLLLELRSRYSVILVDSPPLAAGVDAFTLATLTGNLLLVLRTGRTDRGLAEAKLDILDRLPVRVLGAILNGIDDSAGVYRYYSYSPAYAALPPGVDSENGKES